MRNWRQKLISKHHSELLFSPRHSNLRRTRHTCVTRQTIITTSITKKKTQGNQDEMCIIIIIIIGSLQLAREKKKKAPFS